MRTWAGSGQGAQLFANSITEMELMHKGPRVDTRKHPRDVTMIKVTAGLITPPGVFVAPSGLF